ncbi:MAG: hypothetical protein EXR69_01490 [Myxococcales bacterium]|nr:hypothetical protein [Myxococcales bacterium]
MSESTDVVKEIEDLLTEQLNAEQKVTGVGRRNGLIVVAIAGAYLIGMSWVASEFLDPEGLALAASGYAVEAVPAGAAQIHALVVEGAPDLAKLGAQQLIAQIPSYRVSLEQQIDPVIDEVAGVLADAAVKKMAASSGDPNATYSDDAALEVAATAAVESLDLVLSEAMQEKGENGESPQHTITESLTGLKRIDTELSRGARKEGDPAERELLLAWLNVLGTADLTIEREAPNHR